MVASRPLFADVADEMTDVDEPAPEDFIVNLGDIEEPELGDFASAPAWEELNERVSAMRIKHRRSENDTGSPEYQVAGMTERIAYLTGHMKEHPKDFSTRRGLVALVNKRRRLLNYLFQLDVQRYYELVASLGTRHRAPSKIQTKVEKYGRFPAAKPTKYKNKQLYIKTNA
jgi:small subunit ribosomal protein S15